MLLEVGILIRMRTGQSIADRYELSSLIGRGGMAEVWCATDGRLERDVAVKFLAPRLAEDPEFLVRFFAEAQAVARISHPGVVAVLDFGHEHDSPYLVMEYVGGGSLNDLLEDSLTVERAIEITAQAARGAGAAHELGIVHRDIKPANVLLDESGNAKLADFGISAYKAAERFTVTGTAIGSPYYISPEQVSGGEATPASDVYSLGIVLYELLTGVRPFEAENVTAVAIAQVDKQPEPPSAHRPDLEPWVDELVLRCLAKDPNDRFRDGNAFAAALSGALASEIPSKVGSLDFIEQDEPVSSEPRSGLLPTALVATMLLLAAAGVLASTAGSGSDGVAEAVERPGSTGKPSASVSPSPAPSTTVSAVVATPDPSASPDEKEDKDKPSKDGSTDGSATETDESEPEPTPTPEASGSTQPSPTPTPEGQQAAVESPDGSGN